jgi:demethylmenaquinone methyltransferase / 2-methoxy-6-polyprenyl-1,4-benzoquinol methylase
MEAERRRAREALRPHPVLPEYYGDEAGRRRNLARLFDESAGSYDRITQWMAFGSGHWYRQRVLQQSGLRQGHRLLDVACGSGVLATFGRAMVGAGGMAVGLDPSLGMLAQARRRGARPLVRGFAEALPFADGRFDRLTMGYALRHVGDLRRTFAEYRRVLRPGGRLVLLEITAPRGAVGRGALRLYMRGAVPLVARRIGGDAPRRLMEYYWDTIESCVPPEAILAALTDAGFADVRRRVLFGILSEYLAARPG